MRVHNETDKGLVLSLFNNAHHEQEKDSVSTGMTFNLDLVDYTASNMRNDSDPNDPQVADTQGSFQYLPDAASASSHSLLDYGNDPVLKEFDGAGNIVLTAQFGAGPAESYRGFKFQWSATPYWKPAVVAKKASDGTTDVYMSWNGATEHDSWAIYSSDSQDARATTFVGAYPRTGFETHVSLKNVSDSYIQVAARRGKTTLRKSNVVAV